MQPAQLPQFINAYHIQSILKISYPEASNLLDLNICPLYIIGNSRRVLTNDFYSWLQSKKEIVG